MFFLEMNPTEGQRLEDELRKLKEEEKLLEGFPKSFLASLGKRREKGRKKY